MDAWQIAGIGAGGVVATIAAMDYMFPWIKYDIATVKGYGAMLRALEKFKKSGKHLADVLDEKCRANPQKPFLIFGVSSVTHCSPKKKGETFAIPFFSQDELANPCFLLHSGRIVHVRGNGQEVESSG